MKNFFAVIMTLFFLIHAGDGLAAIHTLTFDVDGMGWGDSETRVSSILDQYQTISDYYTDTSAESATITFDDQKLDMKALKEELHKAGFQTDGLQLN